MEVFGEDGDRVDFKGVGCSDGFEGGSQDGEVFGEGEEGAAIVGDDGEEVGASGSAIAPIIHECVEVLGTIQIIVRYLSRRLG